MNKNESVTAIAQRAEVSKAEAQRILDALTDTVSSALKSGDNVALVGFGTFEVNKRAARTGRNPSTGETIQIAEATLPKFKPGKTLKEAVNT